MKYGALLLSVACLGQPFSAHAQTAAKTVIVDAGARWVIDTDSVEATKQIRKGGELLEVPIYPERLIRIEQPVIDIGTKGVKVSAGKQFIEYRLASGKTVFCSSGTLDTMKSGGSIFYMRYTGTFICLVDTNADGRLDGVYEIRSRLKSATPIVTHGKESGYEAIEPVSFTDIDPRTFDNPTHLRLRWVRGNGLNDSAQFEASINMLTFYRLEGLPKGRVPGTFQYLNMTISLSSPVAKTLDAKITKMGRGVKMLTSGESVNFLPLDPQG